MAASCQHPGDIFGEVALLSTGKRTANCTALGFVDLAVLTKGDLAAVMADFPASAAAVRRNAAERVRELAVRSRATCHRRPRHVSCHVCCHVSARPCRP